ncbi:MAG TPA: N-acetylmuramoyl-L-alanine amidase [Nitrospira sp.]|nr:N-acetylmuramoyl-L-alanine amidase [Nitrospira sp.]
MPATVFRVAALILVLGLLMADGFLPDGAWLGPAHAASQDQRRDHQRASKRSRNSNVSLSPNTIPLAKIQNLRTAFLPDSLRLVLDLDRKTQVKKHRPAQEDGVVVEIPHAALTKSAQAKIAQGVLEGRFVVKQTIGGSVTVALPSGSFETYSLLSLTNPPRLVVDVIPSGLQPSGSVPDPADSSMLSAAPPQPVPPRARSYRTIVIDPGHGGRDPGAHGQRGTEEKDITLKVGLKLRDLLRKDPNVRVLMTRERDVFVELEDRARFANGNEADLFLSIHVNSHPQRSVRGIEIYHFGEAKDQRALELAARENGTPLGSAGVGWEYLVADLLTSKKIEASLELAWNTKEAMIAHLNGEYALVDHGVKTAPFYVLRFTSMPSILTEIAYISNAAEEDLLRTGGFTTRIAESLHEGVTAFLAASKTPAR